MDHAGRVKMEEASRQVTYQYMGILCEFLHDSRGYFTMSDDEADALVQHAMDMLQDPRHLDCVDGLTLLLNCLPTKYHNYAHWVPQWVSLWSSMNHNAQWDLCWLTLLTRARKHTDIRTFSWQALLPLLTLKARELAALPEVTGMSFGCDDFPFVFPCYFSPQGNDANASALNKVTKLMYFAAMQEALLASSSGTIGPGNSSGVCECVYVDPLTITPPSLSSSEPSIRDHSTTSSTATVNPLQLYPGYNEGVYVLSGVAETVAFFQSLRSFYYASISDDGFQNLAYFTATFVGELCRHVGLSLGHQLLGPEAYAGTSAGGVNGGSKYFAFEAPLHLPSVRYLAGMLTLLSLEGLYGMNQTQCTFNLQVCSLVLSSPIPNDGCISHCCCTSYSVLFRTCVRWTRLSATSFCPSCCAR